MTLEAWLRGKATWIMLGALAANGLGLVLVIAALSMVLEAQAMPLEELALEGTAIGTVSLAALLTWALRRAVTLRSLAAQRTDADDARRLLALGELRPLGARVLRGTLVVWAVAPLATALAWWTTSQDSWRGPAQVALAGVLVGPLVAICAAMLATVRAHEVMTRLAVGLSVAAVIGADEPRTASTRSRIVIFTVLFVVLPSALLIDVGVVSIDRLLAQLVEALPGSRQALAASGARWLLGQFAILIFAVAVLAVVTARAATAVLARPLAELTLHVRRVAAGRLAPQVIAADGEVWLVTRVFAQLEERLTGLVKHLRRAGGSVARATSTLSDTSRRYESTAADQAAAVNQTSATTAQLALNARQVAASAASVQELARQTLAAAEQGRGDAETFQTAVERMHLDNAAIATAVERLEKRVLQIGRIIELINAVAERSDLLALSAELEGTRAGEVGRGFSLVGAEMRRLAENVLESTAEIDGLIAEIREATARTSIATARGSTLTSSSTALAEQVTRALSAVAELARQTSSQGRAISLATQQQESGTTQLSAAMGELHESTRDRLSLTHDVTLANQHLLTLAARLDEAVRRFTLDEPAA
jgi:methyl-accepting chemotaxis protein